MKAIKKKDMTKATLTVCQSTREKEENSRTSTYEKPSIPMIPQQEHYQTVEEPIISYAPVESIKLVDEEKPEIKMEAKD